MDINITPDFNLFFIHFLPIIPCDFGLFPVGGGITFSLLITLNTVFLLMGLQHTFCESTLTWSVAATQIKTNLTCGHVVWILFVWGFWEQDNESHWSWNIHYCTVHSAVIPHAPAYSQKNLTLKRSNCFLIYRTKCSINLFKVDTQNIPFI